MMVDGRGPEEVSSNSCLGQEYEYSQKEGI